ncbi:MAG: PilT/PilU family type 4a pilus ATPase [Myxococcaceae bacterium]|nr:PilT/PilU family type 4a pilus ATPase [Myxococcaceae bacterium]MCA3012208.1 PilT/PilU family type 4a pilus ATPase [Myxococcaceae bacterium]
MQTQEDALVGRIALHYKLISPEQLSAASQRQSTDRRPLSALLVDLKFISTAQAKWLDHARQQFFSKNPGSTGATPAPAQPAEVRAPEPAPPAPAPPVPRPVTVAPVNREGLPSLQQILTRAFEAKASDVHIHARAPLQMRVNGVLKELKTGALEPAMVEAILKDALSAEQRALLDEHWDLDLALALPGVGRFRASFYKQQRGWDAVFRTIPPTPPTLEQLGLPQTLAKLTDFHQGLLLITGPAGCGKSSTMAALLSMLNASRQDHIITVEDPIEYVHAPQGCVVNQRQANKHTRSFANALRAALREDPDIIMIGELRDLETIQLAISAAETGHLVMGTLHTNNAIRTINRILDVFPPKQQSQIRAMVSESLRAIVSQRLVLSADGNRRIPVLEVLYVKPSISNLIREEKTFQIRSVMQTGRSEGMCLLDDSLAELVKSGQITKAEARRHAEDPKRFA